MSDRVKTAPDTLGYHFSTVWQPDQHQDMDSPAPAHPPRMRLIDDFLARAPASPCLPRARPAPPPRRQASTRIKQPRIHFGSEHEYLHPEGAGSLSLRRRIQLFIFIKLFFLFTAF